MTATHRRAARRTPRISRSSTATSHTSGSSHSSSLSRPNSVCADCGDGISSTRTIVSPSAGRLRAIARSSVRRFWVSVGVGRTTTCGASSMLTAAEVSVVAASPSGSRAQAPSWSRRRTRKSNVEAAVRPSISTRRRLSSPRLCATIRRIELLPLPLCPTRSTFPPLRSAFSATSIVWSRSTNNARSRRVSRKGRPESSVVIANDYNVRSVRKGA